MNETYALGHSEQELARLERQGRFLGGLTRDLLVRAGVGPGMRVLDFGAGAGDVSLLAAELVGPTGEVVAVERSAEAMARMRARLLARGARNVRIVEADDLSLPTVPGGFDAVIGRLVLLHQRDLDATLARLLDVLRPGGVVAFHEIDIEAGAWSVPRLALVDRAFDWIVGAFTRGGMPTDIGRRLARLFSSAGLEAPRIIREASIEGGPDSEGYEFLAQTVRTLLPVIVRLGLATAAEIDVDTLAARMRAEATEKQARFVPCFLVAAWARKPAHLEAK